MEVNKDTLLTQLYQEPQQCVGKLFAFLFPDVPEFLTRYWDG